MSSPEGPRSNLDEEKEAIPTTEKHGNSVRIDLAHYYEQSAGRLVLDPKCVCFFLLSRWFLFLITHATERRTLNLETRLPHDSSFHRMEGSSSGLNRLMIRKTLKTSVHVSKKADSDYNLIDPMLSSGPNGGRLFS
jgi:hypothetical protein